MEELINKIDYLREELNIFINNGYFEIKQQGKFLFFGVKKGYTKNLILKGYNKKTILKYLNLIEFGLNNGLICEKCLKVGIFGKDETNAFISKCKEHGSLI